LGDVAGHPRDAGYLAVLVVDRLPAAPHPPPVPLLRVDAVLHLGRLAVGYPPHRVPDLVPVVRVDAVEEVRPVTLEGLRRPPPQVLVGVVDEKDLLPVGGEYPEHVGGALEELGKHPPLLVRVGFPGHVLSVDVEVTIL
jgi:hypothetical protein